MTDKLIDKPRLDSILVAERKSFEALEAAENTYFQGKHRGCAKNAENVNRVVKLMDSPDTKQRLIPPSPGAPIEDTMAYVQQRRKQLEPDLKKIQTFDAATPICDMVLDDGVPARRKCHFPHARRASSNLCKSRVVSWAVQTGNKLQWVAGTINGNSGDWKQIAVNETEPFWFEEKNGKRLIGEPNNVLSYAHLVVTDDVQAQSSSGWHRLVYACLVDPVREELLDFAVTSWTPGDEAAKALRRALKIADTRDRQPLRSPDQFTAENRESTLDPASDREKLLMMMAAVTAFDKYCRAFGRMSDEDIATFEKEGRDGGLTKADQPRVDEYAKMFVTQTILRFIDSPKNRLPRDDFGIRDGA